MTIFEYISQQFASLGLVLNEADCVNMGLWNHSEQLTESNQPEIYTSFVQYLPSILLRPTSVSEGGVSITRAQKADIEVFYNAECANLGIRNVMKPRLRFI